MISPSFVEEVERQRRAASAELAHAVAAGDDSGVAAATARLADLDDICVRTAELPVLLV